MAWNDGDIDHFSFVLLLLLSFQLSVMLSFVAQKQRSFVLYMTMIMMNALIPHYTSCRPLCPALPLFQVASAVRSPALHSSEKETIWLLPRLMAQF